MLDTNGAGDTFATAYMLSEAAGHSNPISVAHWAGGMAVSQPQACKPACVTSALRTGWATLPPSSTGQAWAPLQRLLPAVRPIARLLGLAPSTGSKTAAAAA